jgi:hypothetical protein
VSQQSSCALSTAGRHHPGMVGDIISERWAASNRNAGRHHVGILGGSARNPHTFRSSVMWASERLASWSSIAQDSHDHKRKGHCSSPVG